MSLRIAFLGDRHVSSRSPRYRHALDMWDFALEDAKDQGASIIVGLGDVCEGDPNGDERYQLGDLYMRPGFTMYETLGNHCSYEALRWLEYLGVHVAWDQLLTTDLGECVLVCAPYARKGRPPYDDLAGNDIGSTSRAASDKLAAHIRSVVSATQKPVIVAGHWTIEGMRIGDSELESHALTEMVVPVSAFDGCAGVFTGHIHKAQEITPTIVGVGSLYRTSFSEASDPKSYTLVTIDGGRVSWERRPVPAREMVVEMITWQDRALVGDSSHDIDIRHLASTVAGKEVKLTVEIREEELPTFDASVFDPIKDAAAHFVLEKVTVAAQRTRAPQIATAASLSDQVAAWLGATGQGAMSEGLRAKVGKVE